VFRGDDPRRDKMPSSQNSREKQDDDFTARAAVYGVGAALLVAYFAAANMPTQEAPSRERGRTPAATAGSESLAVEVRVPGRAAARAHGPGAGPRPNPRNPFSFVSAARRASRAEP